MSAQISRWGAQLGIDASFASGQSLAATVSAALGIDLSTLTDFEGQPALLDLEAESFFAALADGDTLVVLVGLDPAATVNIWKEFDGATEAEAEAAAAVTDQPTFPFVAQSTWHIIHNQKRYPTIICLVGGAKVEGDVSYFDVNVAQVAFSRPVTGTAYLT